MVACQPPSERRAVSFSRGSSQPVFASRFASHAYRAAKATMKSFRRLGGRAHRPRYRRCADEFRGPPWLFLNETALRSGGGWYAAIRADREPAPPRKDPSRSASPVPLPITHKSGLNEHIWISWTQPAGTDDQRRGGDGGVGRGGDANAGSGRSTEESAGDPDDRKVLGEPWRVDSEGMRQSG